VLAEAQEALDAEEEDEGDHQVDVLEDALTGQGWLLGFVLPQVYCRLLRHIKIIDRIQIKS